MIAYDLRCGKGHTFEGWFDDLISYENQKRESLISCPFCDDTDISRMPSTFAIKSTQLSRDCPEQKNVTTQLGKQIVEFFEKNFDNVGSNFATEALKIHYGVSEPRNIRGVSSDEEEKILRKEGVKFMKVPMPPSSDHDA
jgi:hypothetical protein